MGAPGDTRTHILTRRTAELAKIDDAIQADARAPLSRHFSGWPIEDFGALYLANLSDLPALAARLPKMPPAEIQRRYTWYDGAELMRRNVNFVRSLVLGYQRWTDAVIEQATVLDYGAGWGRLSRMLLQFVPDERVYACDAWRPSIELYNTLGFVRPCDLVGAVPTTLPYEPGQFDLVWLYSVLTHLPATTADAVMRAVHRIVRPGGLVVATIRPLDFWRSNPLVSGRVDPTVLIEQHLREGFAHVPHQSAPEWGDSSMSLDYMAQRWPEWRVVATEDNWTHQTIVFLQPRP